MTPTERRSDPAQLRHRMMLERPTEAPDGQGGKIAGFEPVAQIWVALSVIDGQTIEEAGRTVALTRYRLTIRHRPDIRPGWRLVSAAHSLLVASLVDPDASARWLVIEAEERR